MLIVETSLTYSFINYLFIDILYYYMARESSLEVNPSFPIGSFLVRISPYGPFPWKRSKAVYFGFLKPANSKQAWPECHIINYLLT